VAQQTPLLPFRSTRPRSGGGERGRIRRETVQPKLTNGRAWINGREVGGTDARFAHLDRSYD
jgi:hypothetical protein